MMWESCALRIPFQSPGSSHSSFTPSSNKIIIKGKVLGTVDHYMWKKEYQNRGAPHYHVLLWIQDAPVIGVDDADKVLAWIEDRITFQIKRAIQSCMHW